MKMHVLAVTVFAVLAARAAIAASEGGDTWSAVQAVQPSTYSALRSVPRPWAEDSAWVGSEGGDTWSSLQALHETTIQQAGTQDRIARTDSTYAVQTGASEGGDTWSRIAPQPEGRSTGTVGLAAKPAF